MYERRTPLAERRAVDRGRTWVTLVWEDNQRKGEEKTPGIEGEMEQSELGRGIDG